MELYFELVTIFQVVDVTIRAEFKDDENFLPQEGLTKINSRGGISGHFSIDKQRQFN